MKLFIGIDPGESGAFAVLDEDNKIVILKTFKSSSYVDFKEEITLMQKDHEGAVVAIEKVHANPSMGSKGSFSFGANFGGWCATMQLLELPHLLVPPQTWQKAILGTVPKGESKPRALAYAQRLYPKERFLKKDHGIIDALLIALWAKNNFK